MKKTLSAAGVAAPTDEKYQRLEAVVAQVGTAILGKEHAIRLAFACLLARGHLLIEDLPGMGKTTLAYAFAHTLALHYQRIQFTSDLLPADILGAAVYDHGAFTFHPGPIFAQLILADELNRATPKTQSALLEAMEENQVTSEGQTRPLPKPFFVIATQNPSYQIGAFPLPESQLDRFLMRIELGYPDMAAERALLQGQERRELVDQLPACMEPEQLLELQNHLATIHVAPALLDYVQALLDYSRRDSAFRHGLSPRAGLALLRAARAWALLGQRDYVLPEDVQTVLPAVVGHRLHPGEEHLERSTEDLTAQLIDAVRVPA